MKKFTTLTTSSILWKFANCNGDVTLGLPNVHQSIQVITSVMNITKISGRCQSIQSTGILTSRGPGISSLQTSCSGTPNLTFSSLLGYGRELGCPQDVTTLLNVAARRCILLAQLLILPVYRTSGFGRYYKSNINARCIFRRWELNNTYYCRN